MSLADILDRTQKFKQNKKIEPFLRGVSQDPWGTTGELRRSERLVIGEDLRDSRSSFFDEPEAEIAAGESQEDSVGASQAKSIAHDDQKDFYSSFPRKAAKLDSLILPAPLKSLPSGWEIEVQRITHSLSLGLHNGPQVVLLTSLVRRSGVSTIASLIGHHLAGSGLEGRTLVIDYAHSGRAPSKDHYLLHIGDAFSWRQLPLNHALNCLSLRGGEEFSVVEKLRWFRSLLGTAKTMYRHIIVDAPPFMHCAESHLLAGESNGVVLVTKSGAVRKPALAAQVSEIHRMSVPVLGVILTFRRYPIPKWLLRWI